MVYRDSTTQFPPHYRAHISADDRGAERTAFVEAASPRDAARKIADAVAAFEGRSSDTVERLIYNLASARELIEMGVSEDFELRLFETGWNGGKAVSFVQEPLFLLAAPSALILKWAQLKQEVAHG
jgi:hypothetical protein